MIIMNGKTIVIYTSKYGSAEKYAKWIAEALACPVKGLKDIHDRELSDYDTIIYGGGLYAGSVAGIKKFLQQLNSSNEKRLILFMVGMTNPAEKDIYEELAKRNLPQEWREKFEIFSFRGDLNFSKMSGLHKLMMRMRKSIAEKSPETERTEDDRQFLETFGSDVIFTSREQVEPLVNFILDGEKGIHTAADTLFTF